MGIRVYSLFWVIPYGPYRTESVHFSVPMNSATKTGSVQGASAEKHFGRDPECCPSRLWACLGFRVHGLGFRV